MRTLDTDARWCFWRWQIIKDDKGDPYLSRFALLKTPLFCVFLHWIHQPDHDRELHDHPWSFVSFVVKGGYTEIRGELSRSRRELLGTRRRVVRGMNISGSVHPHRIESVKPGTITLVFTGRRRKSWGFYRVTGAHRVLYIPWKEYV